MSVVTRAVLNSFATEADRLRAAAASVRDGAIPSEAAFLPTYVTPTQYSVVDTTNLVLDPQNHLKAWEAWQGSYTSRFALTADLEDVPPRYERSTLATGLGGGTTRLRIPFMSTDAGTYYGYVLLKADGGSSLAVSFYQGSTQVGTVTTVAANSAIGWTVVKVVGALAAATQYTIDVNAGSVSAGFKLRATGATACALVDPGESFDGDRALDGPYLYSWASAAHQSQSLRRVPQRDFLAMRELSAGFSPAPVGLTVEQRRTYLLSRVQARGHAWGSMFVDLIVKLIQSEHPSFSPGGVRVVDDAGASTMHVEIAYDPSGRLAARLEQLIEATRPIHLGMSSIVWGAFTAGPDMKTTTLTGSQNLNGPGATATVAATAGWAASGYFEVNGTQYSYSGIGSGTTFTGVAKLAAAPVGWRGTGWSNGSGGSQAGASLVRQIDYAYGQAGEPL